MFFNIFYEHKDHVWNKDISTVKYGPFLGVHMKKSGGVSIPRHPNAECVLGIWVQIPSQVFRCHIWYFSV